MADDSVYLLGRLRHSSKRNYLDDELGEGKVRSEK